MVIEQWSCAACGQENAADAMICQRCGRLAGAAKTGGIAASRTQRPSEVRDALASEPSISGQVRGELTDALRNPFADSAAPAGLGGSDQASRRSIAASPYGRSALEDVKVDLEFTDKGEDGSGHKPRLCYAWTHAGLPFIKSLQITNNGRRPIHDVGVTLELAPGYGGPWQRSYARINPESRLTALDIVIPLDVEKMKAVGESQPNSAILVQVSVDGHKTLLDTYQVVVLPYNDWLDGLELCEYADGRRQIRLQHPQLLASFIQPTSRATEHFVSKLRDRLKREVHDPTLAPYSRGKESVVTILAALYDVLQSDLEISYVLPAPSFQGIQRVLLSDHVLRDRRGTCLDLAILWCSILERVHLHPLLVMVEGHAFFGVWLQDVSQVPRDELPVIHSDLETLVRMQAAGNWLFLNSTTFTDRERPFMMCLQEAQPYLNEQIFQCVIDVRAARHGGALPMPPLA